MEGERSGSMFCVAICDDEEVLCSQIEKILQPCMEKGALKVDIFYDGESLCEAMSGGAHYDLIFLDIELEAMDGVAAGKKIRTELKNRRVQIVYISAKQEYVMDLFSVQPMNFLVKPISADAILENIELAMEITGCYDTCFEFHIGTECFRIPYGDIVYFESSNRKVRLHTKYETKELYGKLKVIEEEAPPNFIRIHQSYLINRTYVTFWKSDNVLLNDRYSLPVSQAYRKRVNKLLLQSER